MFATVSTVAPATDVLVLAAHAVELEGLAPLLRESNAADVHSPPTSSRPPAGRASVVQLDERRVACAAVGVGLTAAGAGAARALAEHLPRAVVLIGSFGRYPHSAVGSDPCDAYVAERVKLIDAAVAQRKGAFPAPMPIDLALDRALSIALERHGARRMPALGTTLSITTDDELARALGESSGCDGENLEAIAVAHACACAGVPCAVLVACTNEVGSRGRAAWLTNHAEAARSTARILEAFLSSRAGG
jgi:nucleoside phosphorylase